MSHHPEQHKNDEISAESLTSFSRPNRLLNSHFAPKEMGPTAFIIHIAHREVFFSVLLKKKLQNRLTSISHAQKWRQNVVSLSRFSFCFSFSRVSWEITVLLPSAAKNQRREGEKRHRTSAPSYKQLSQTIACSPSKRKVYATQKFQYKFSQSNLYSFKQETSIL